MDIFQIERILEKKKNGSIPIKQWAILDAKYTCSFSFTKEKKLPPCSNINAYYQEILWMNFQPNYNLM